MASRQEAEAGLIDPDGTIMLEDYGNKGEEKSGFLTNVGSRWRPWPEEKKPRRRTIRLYAQLSGRYAHFNSRTPAAWHSSDPACHAWRIRASRSAPALWPPSIQAQPPIRSRASWRKRSKIVCSSLPKFGRRKRIRPAGREFSL